MKDIQNTANVILFAFLITIMILPFNGIAIVIPAQAEEIPTREQLDQKKAKRHLLIEKNYIRLAEISTRMTAIQQELKALHSDGVSWDSPSVNTLGEEWNSLKDEIKMLEDQTRVDVDPELRDKFKQGKKLLGESGLDYHLLYRDLDYLELVIGTKDGSPEFEAKVRSILGDIPYRIEVGPNNARLLSGNLTQAGDGCDPLSSGANLKDECGVDENTKLGFLFDLRSAFVKFWNTFHII